jgi:hypothetical protein
LVSAIEIELTVHFGILPIQAAERAEKVASVVADIIAARRSRLNDRAWCLL